MKTIILSSLMFLTLNTSAEESIPNCFAKSQDFARNEFLLLGNQFQIISALKAYGFTDVRTVGLEHVSAQLHTSDEKVQKKALAFLQELKDQGIVAAVYCNGISAPNG